MSLLRFRPGVSLPHSSCFQMAQTDMPPSRRASRTSRPSTHIVYSYKSTSPLHTCTSNRRYRGPSLDSLFRMATGLEHIDLVRYRQPVDTRPDRRARVERHHRPLRGGGGAGSSKHERPPQAYPRAPNTTRVTRSAARGANGGGGGGGVRFDKATRYNTAQVTPQSPQLDNIRNNVTANWSAPQAYGECYNALLNDGSTIYMVINLLCRLWFENGNVMTKAKLIRVAMMAYLAWHTTFRHVFRAVAGERKRPAMMLAALAAIVVMKTTDTLSHTALTMRKKSVGLL